MSRAYAASGAVIISDDGAHVKYHPQCPKCGFVMEGTTGSAYVPSNIRSNVGVATCPKCGALITIQINRDC